MGYQRNKYNWFMMKNIFKGKQCTILWHYDDLKMPHVDSDVVSFDLTYIDTEYGEMEK